MKRKIIDLSVLLEDVPMQPARHRPSIQYTDHDDTWNMEGGIATGLPREAFLEGKAWATEHVSLSTHSGTHMDSPWHYHPTMNRALKPGGERAATIEQVPLDWCMRPGVKLDFRHFPAGYVVTPADLDQELDRIGHVLQPLDIVLVNTRAAERYGEDDYWLSNCGIGYDATMHLLERGVRVVGTDAWGWDVPFAFSEKEYGQTGDWRSVWGGHKAGAEIGYFQMEKLTNLDRLPGSGFTVCCFPVKLKGASAAWTRAVAIIEE